MNFRLITSAIMLLMVCACTSVVQLKEDLSERVFGREQASDMSELVTIEKPSIQGKLLWKTSLSASLDFDFTPAVADGFVYAASLKGVIVKINANTGQIAWRINTGEDLTGGVGVADGKLLVGSEKGYLIAYDLNGKPLWKTKLSSQVLSVPMLDANIAVVRCGDSRIYGVQLNDGSKKWVYERSNPTLTIRSSAGVAVGDGFAYAGFAGGKMVAIRVEDGKLVWEVSVAQPKGTTEIERIADITSSPVIDGPLVYAVAYQGKVAAVERGSGRVIWNRDISSYTGLDADGGKVFIAHANSAIYALDYASGKTFWRQADLKQRRITAPLPLDSAVVVGDVEGYLHFLSREDGSFLGRMETSSGAVMPKMTSLGKNSLVAQNRNGDVYAVSIK
jgi:outer membrane protein assembly factor BamB